MMNKSDISDIVKAKADGRLVVLPCKVGDTVYCVFEGVKKVLSHTVGGFVIERCKTMVTDDKSGCKIAPICNFGKTVFLTREEAEAALAGKKWDEAGD